MKKSQFWISRDDGEAVNVFFWREEPIKDDKKGFVTGTQQFVIEDVKRFEELFGFEPLSGEKFEVKIEAEKK